MIFYQPSFVAYRARNSYCVSANKAVLQKAKSSIVKHMYAECLLSKSMSVNIKLTAVKIAGALTALMLN